MVLYSAYIPLMNDFEVYYYGGSRVLQTGEAGVNELYAPRDGLPFTYPPFAALLFAGLATLSLAPAAWSSLRRRWPAPPSCPPGWPGTTSG